MHFQIARLCKSQALYSYYFAVKFAFNLKVFFRKVLPLRWLRDHDRSSTGYNHKTFQRKVETFSIDPTVLKIKNIREENSVIHIKWDDDVETEYPTSFIKDSINFDPKDKMTTDKSVFDLDGVEIRLQPIIYRVIFEKTSPDRFDSLNHLWTGDELFDLMAKTNVPSYKELIDETTQNETRKNMMDTLVKYGVCWLKDTPSDHSATVRAAKIFSCEQPNVFGTDWSFTADGARADRFVDRLRLSRLEGR